MGAPVKLPRPSPVGAVVPELRQERRVRIRVVREAGGYGWSVWQGARWQGWSNHWRGAMDRALKLAAAFVVP